MRAPLARGRAVDPDLHAAALGGLHGDGDAVAHVAAPEERQQVVDRVREAGGVTGLAPEALAL